MPTFVAKFIVDFVETGIAAILALNLVFPTTVPEAKQVAVVIGVALAGALVSAFRRNYPSFITWLRQKLGAQ